MSNGQRALSPWDRLESIVRRAIFGKKPGLAIYDAPVFARVLKARFAGGKVDGRNKGFSVDVQVVDHELLDDPAWAPITDVPIDPQTFGENGALYTVPKKGAIVRLAFMYHNPAFPFIMSITAEGQTLPEGAADEFRVQIGDITFQITKDTLKFKTKNYNTDIEVLVDAILEHLHTGNTGSPTSNTQGAVPPTLPTDFQKGGL
jgi:hypothetical protein